MGGKEVTFSTLMQVHYPLLVSLNTESLVLRCVSVFFLFYSFLSFGTIKKQLKSLIGLFQKYAYSWNIIEIRVAEKMVRMGASVNLNKIWDTRSIGSLLPTWSRLPGIGVISRKNRQAYSAKKLL